MSSGFGGGKYFRYAVWIFKKKLQVWVRSHISHTLALSLGLLVVFRERSELALIIQRISSREIPSQEWWLVAWLAFLVILLCCYLALLWRGQLTPKIVLLTLTGGVAGAYCISREFSHLPGLVARSPAPFEWLVLFITLGTIVAALWESFGNKLSTSEQEIRFAQGMRVLLNELEKFCYGKDRISDSSQRLDEFLNGFMQITSTTICSHRKVDAGFMIKMPGENTLTLINASKDAPYPAVLNIPLPTPSQQTGAAGVAFDEARIAYVPNKNTKDTWPFELVRGQYEPSEPRQAWITSDRENFHSALCVPVAVYREKGQKQRFGVLNFSTRACDPFVDRDFLMSECFASILSHAIAFSQQERERKERTA